jgi:transcriptional regulator with XRE-family HTH domain
MSREESSLMQKLKDFRIRNGFSQGELGDIVGISQAAISSYEVGTREPTHEILIKLAIVLNTTVDELIEFRKIHDQIGNDLLEKIQKIKEPKS